MNIKILGTGCPNCKALYNLTNEIITEHSIKATIEKVEDIIDIIKYNIIASPGIVINEKLVLSGRIPSRKELTSLIIKNRGL